MLEHGADSNAEYSFEKWNPKKSAIIHKEVFSPLKQAIQSQFQPALDLILKPEYKVNLSHIVENESPLLYAVKVGYGVESLLAAGADPNQVWKNQTDTPLSQAVRSGKATAIVALLTKGALVNTPVCYQDELIQVNRETPLHIALKNQDAVALALGLLLDAGANPAIPFQYVINNRQYDVPYTEICTSQECRELLAARHQKPSCLTM